MRMILLKNKIKNIYGEEKISLSRSHVPSMSNFCLISTFLAFCRFCSSFYIMTLFSLLHFLLIISIICAASLICFCFLFDYIRLSMDEKSFSNTVSNPHCINIYAKCYSLFLLLYFAFLFIFFDFFLYE